MVTIDQGQGLISWMSFTKWNDTLPERESRLQELTGKSLKGLQTLSWIRLECPGIWFTSDNVSNQRRRIAVWEILLKWRFIAV